METQTLSVQSSPTTNKAALIESMLGHRLIERTTNRLVEKEGIDKGTAEKMRLAFVRFASLRRLHPTEPIVPSPAVDTFWHTALLFTGDYAAWCEAHFDRFFHHEPNDGFGKKMAPGGYARTREHITAAYPDFDTTMWPACNAALCCTDDDCCSDDAAIAQATCTCEEQYDPVCENEPCKGL